jgi:imidazolonepropionase-like amidohydrolase
MKKLSFCFALLLAVAGAFAQSVTYLHCGRLLDFTGAGARVKTAVTVTVEDQQITAVEAGYLTAPEGVRTVDFLAHTVLPGSPISLRYRAIRSKIFRG